MDRKRCLVFLVILPFSVILAVLLLVYLIAGITGDDLGRPSYEESSWEKASADKDGSTCSTAGRTRAGKDLDRGPGPAVAIIIDDLGYDPHLAGLFMDLDLDLTVSILPFAPFTSRIVEQARAMGREIMLHQPMEPKGYPEVDPGPGALFVSMSGDEIARILAGNLREVKGARGVNNHMGSLFTENRHMMGIVLRELKRRGLFFVDSRTTAGTVVLEEAGKIGLPAAERTVFLDNDQDREAIGAQIEHLLDIARTCGTAVGIGHPHLETLETLEDYKSELKREFRIVPVSELVR